jgi:hypothetical protein
VQQFETNSLFKAFYLTIVRILKCNQLFAGGIDYPIVKKKLRNIQYKKINIKYWYLPMGNDKYLIVKNWNYKHETKQQSK